MSGTVVQLNRAQLSQAKQFPFVLDVTIKNAGPTGKPFAPTWDMVLNHKNGTLSDQEYTDQYFEILNKLTDSDILNLYDLVVESAKQKSLTFLCFCKDNEFCHTHLLIKWLCNNHPLLFCNGR